MCSRLTGSSSCDKPKRYPEEAVKRSAGDPRKPQQLLQGAYGETRKVDGIILLQSLTVTSKDANSLDYLTMSTTTNRSRPRQSVLSM